MVSGLDNQANEELAHIASLEGRLAWNLFLFCADC